MTLQRDYKQAVSKRVLIRSEYVLRYKLTKSSDLILFNFQAKHIESFIYSYIEAIIH